MIDSYTKLSLRLFPRGLFWQALGKKGHALYEIFKGLAAEKTRAHKRVEDALKEGLPSTAIETLNTWEDMLGLPECSNAHTELIFRQAEASAKFAANGGNNAAFYLTIAKRYGETMTIRSILEPARCDHARCGDMAFDRTAVFIWVITGEIPNEKRAMHECLYKRYCPAHNKLVFIYE